MASFQPQRYEKLACGWKKFIQHVWDTNSHKVNTGFVWSFYQRRISGQGTGYYISGMIQITIRIQDRDYYPDRSARVCIFDQFCKIYKNFICLIYRGLSIFCGYNRWDLVKEIWFYNKY